MNDLLPFREPELHDASSVQRCAYQSLQSDLSFANLYLLRHKYHTELVFHMEHLIRHFDSDRLSGYSFPVGGKQEHLMDCFKAIEADAKARNRALNYCLLTEEQAKILHQYYGDRINFQNNSGDADYLYQRVQLSHLAGTAFHKKRTHLSKFHRLYPDATFEILNEHNKKDALTITEGWLHSQENTPALLHEYKAICTALENMELLNLSGAIVYINRHPVCYCIASRMNELVTDIHYEKALPEYRDAYVYINQMFATHADTEWLNREEDLNVPGLRQAKLSYHPSLILSKLSASIC